MRISRLLKTVGTSRSLVRCPVGLWSTVAERSGDTAFAGPAIGAQLAYELPDGVVSPNRGIMRRKGDSRASGKNCVAAAALRIYDRPDLVVARDRSGFSLIEVVLAIGVIAFALVGILGMFPVAMDAATTSQRETHAALIARTLISDLRAVPTGFVLRGTDPAAAGQRVAVDLASTTDQEVFVAFDESGAALPAAVTSGDFSNGVDDAAFVGRVSVRSDTNFPEMARVEVEIAAPGSAAASNRTAYPFVTLIARP